MVASGMGVGGAERIVVSLAAHLREAGHEVTVAAPAGALDAELAALGAARATFPERGRSRAGALLSALAVARALRASRAEVVHAHNVKAAAIAWAATRLARRRPPLLATFHGIEASDDAAAARVLRRMTRVACVAEALAARLRSAGMPAERLAVVPNAVAQAAPLDGARRAAIDAELDLGGAAVVAAVGRLAPVKAHDRLLRAAAELAPHRPDARFLLIGDGPERAALEALAARLGIADRVRFTGTRADARDLIARAGVVVFTSESEGLPLAALEAMDAGVPVLAPAVAGMRELLAAGGGELLEDTQPGTIAAAVGALLDDAPRRARLGDAGRAIVRERYAPARMHAGYDALYAALLERS
jgi:glycosyltransferase involved in cell wall biosynthesis